MAVNIRPYIIINGKSSDEVTGLLICSLPPISKPAMRVTAEEIDGRDGDIVTELGFSAYDKEIEIGLTNDYDVNEVISFFNTSGQVIFSNEPDKYYKFAIYNGIDFEKLIKFKKATVVFHVQPFKFATESNDAVFYSPSNVNITNEGNIYSRPELAIQGSGEIGISVNGSDALEIDLGETQQAIIIDSDGMNAYGTKSNIKELIVDVNPVQDLHGYDSPWVGGAGANKMPDVFNPLPANGDVLVEYPSEISFTGLYISFVFSGKIGAKGGAFIQARDASNNVSMTFTFSNLSDHNNQALSEDVTYSNELVHLSFSQTKAVKKWSFYRNWNPSNDASISNFQLSIGTTATDYSPYENICPISGWNGCDVTRTGANICGGEFLANLIVSTFPSATKDTTNKTVSYTAVNANARKLFDIFKPNTVYTFIIDTASANTNLAVNYTDGTSMRLYAGVNVTASNKSVSYLRGQNQSQSTVLNYENCGVFEGTITADDFQKYAGNIYSIFFDGLLNGTYGYVDMGTLSWVGGGTNIFACTLSGLKVGTSGLSPLLCPIYTTKNITNQAPTQDKTIWQYYNSSNIRVYDTSYDDVSDFQNAMSGVYLIYQLATPTTPSITQADINMLMTAFGIDEESAIVVFGQEVFGATINVTTGLLTITHQIYTFNGTEQWITNGERGVALFINSLNPQIDTSFNPLFEIYKTIYRGEAPANNGEANFNYAYTAIQIHDERAMTATEYKNLLSNNNVKALFKLATPIEIQLTAQEIMTLIGENVLWANTGDINELIYTKDGVDITTSGDIVSFDVDAIDIIDTILKNRLVTGNYDNLRLKAGTNQIAVSGNVNVMALSNFSRWL